MPNPLRKLLISLAILSGLGCLILAWRQPLRPRPGFQADAAFSVIRELSAPGYEGRLTGSPGNRKAMAWIAARFRELGLQPLATAGDYEQPFAALVPEPRATPVLEVLGRGGVIKRYVPYADFRETYAGHSRPGEVVGGARVFESIRSLERGRQPIFLCDGKDIEAIEGMLPGHGIRGIILADRDQAVSMKSGAIGGHWFEDPGGVVKFLVRAAVMAELKAQVRAGRSLRMKADFSMRWVRTANVVGFLPAADGRMDQVEIVSCHLDHLGKDPGGAVFPGALDNASGTGAMLALARTLAAHRSSLTKAFVFAAFNAEEEYLGGSAHLAEHLPVPPARVEVLNFDMAGSRQVVPLELQSVIRSDGEGLLDPIVGPAEARLQRIAGRLGIPVILNRDALHTDHVPFAARLIPAISFVQDAKGDYHTVRDDASSIDRARLGQVGQLALTYLAETALGDPLGWLVQLLGGVALAAGLAALVPPGLWGAAGSRIRAAAPGPVPLGLAGLVLALALAGGTGGGSQGLGRREAAELVAARDRHEATLDRPERMPRPFPSRGNEATAQYLAARFRELGLQPYDRIPGATDGFLKTRALVPAQRSAPVLQLLAADGSVLRDFVRGRDFLETAVGPGGGGRVRGRFRLLRSAYDAAGSPPIACVRKADHQEADEALFAKWGARALLIEGDPSAPVPQDFSENRQGLLDEGHTLLRFIVAPEVMAELARGQGRAALRVEWDMGFREDFARSVIGCIPGREAGTGRELIFSAALDAAQPDPALAFLLALAEAMARKHLRPKHTIVFLACNGTGCGQLGTRAFLDLPLVVDPPDRHAVHLVAGAEAGLWLGSRAASFVLPGRPLADSLVRLGGAGSPLPASAGGTGFPHAWFAERWNPAVTLVLPRSPDRTVELADRLVRFAGADAVAPALTPLEWLRLGAKALGLALGAGLAAGWWTRRVAARKHHPAADPFAAFLERR